MGGCEARWMLDSYPGHLLAREPAPSYPGEGPFALWHVSEAAGLGTSSRGFLPPTRGPLRWFGRSIRAIRRCSGFAGTVLEGAFGRHLRPLVRIANGWSGRVVVTVCT